jgi:hypothetical protein
MAKKKKSRYESSKNLSADSAMIAAANMLLDAGEIAYNQSDPERLVETASEFMNIAATLMGLESLMEQARSSEDEPEEGNLNGPRVKQKIGFVR